MPWFTAKLIYAAKDAKGQVRLREESLRLIKAASAVEAEKTAEKLAKKYLKEVNEHETTVNDQPVKWNLEEVWDVFEMSENPKTGCELYSFIYEKDQMQMRVSFIPKEKRPDPPLKPKKNKAS